MLKHVLGGQFPDPLYIQKEFDEAVKNRDLQRFLSLFEPLPISLVNNIAKQEGLES
jgi:hypothetical protein